MGIGITGDHGAPVQNNAMREQRRDIEYAITQYHQTVENNVLAQNQKPLYAESKNAVNVIIFSVHYFY